MTTEAPTPPPLDLAALTVIAKAASPGNWMWVNDRDDEHIRAGNYPYTHVTQTDDVSDANALHIAAFDPPTVLALIARAEAAEAKLAAVRELHTRRTRQGDPDHCNHCGTGFAPSYIYPCPTIRALDGTA